MKSVNLDREKIEPSKIVCIGRNYVEHIKELNNEIPTTMVIFMKPNSAISEELETKGKELHYEGEISFLIKDSRIYAVGFGLDITDRNLQSKLKKKGLPWERAKAFDGAAVFSDFAKIDSKKCDELSLKLFINEKLVQIGSTKLMIHTPEAILEEIGTFSTIEDGDIVMSGTPKGVGVIKMGDIFRGEIYLGEKLLTSKEWRAS
jgi:2-keto-4-pentenoate hydratase/2-oxohepta-3-ene-1,7-dioic acid hydratase in catechol pathway